MGVFKTSSGGLVRTSSGGLSSAGGTVANLPKTLNLFNESGSNVAIGTQWMFEEHFVEGDIPSGSRAVLKYGGTEITTYQQDMEVPHEGDGSLRSARFWVELPAAINTGSNIDITIDVEGTAPSNTTSITSTDVTTNSDITLEVVESGTTYYIDVNDLVGTAEVVEQGAMAVTWRMADRLHTSVPADHSRLYGLIYLTWFSDDTYRVWAAVGNGAILESHTAQTVTRVSLKDGVSTLIEETSISKSIPGGSWMPVVDSDGEAYWSGGYPDLTAHHDMDYLEDTYVVPRMASSLEAQVGTPTVPAYQFGDEEDISQNTAQGGTSTTIQLASSETFADDELIGDAVEIVSGTGAGQVRRITDYVESTDTATVTSSWSTTPDATSVYKITRYACWPTADRDINQTGPSAWLGHIPQWTGRHLLSMYGTTKAKIRACERLDKVKAAAWMTQPHANLDTNWEHSNFTSNLRTYTGMTARNTVRTHDSESWFGGGGNSWTGVGNGSHAGNPSFGPWLKTGDPWFAEDIRCSANTLAGAIYVPSREKTVGGTTYYMLQDDNQERSTAWTTNHMLMASMVTPTGAVSKEYFDDLVSDQLTGLWKRASVAYASGGHQDTQKALGFIFPSYSSGKNRISPWMQNYCHIVFLRAAMLGFAGADGCVDEYVKKFSLAWANAGRDRTARYRGMFYEADRKILDSTFECQQTWETMWLGFDSTDDRGSDTAYLYYSSASGTFTVGETITGGTSTNTARVIAQDASKLTVLGADLTNLTLAETITGGTSGVTATFDSRGYFGYPAIPNSSLMTGDSAPTDTPDTSDQHYTSLWMAVMGLLGEYTTGADKTAAQGHWDDWWSTMEATWTQAGLEDYAQYAYKYDGAID